MDNSKLKELNKRAAKVRSKNKRRQEAKAQVKQVAEAIILGSKANIEHRDGHEPNVTVKNIQAIADAINKKTFDADSIVDAIALLGSQFSDLPKEIGESVKIPEASKEVAVTNLIDYSESIKEVTKLLKGMGKQPAPEVTVKPADVVVESDNKDVVKALDKLKKAIESQETPVFPSIDNSEVISAVKAVKDSIESIVFPVPETPLPFKDSNNNGVQLGLDADNNVPISFVGAGTSAVTTVSDTATSTTLLTATSGRRKFIITNDSSADLYVKYGTTASTTSYTFVLKQGDTVAESDYTGRVDGIWASDPGDGAARITELT